MRMFFVCLLLFQLGNFVFAAENNGGTERHGEHYLRKYTGFENDPVLQALAALENEELQNEIGEAISIFYSSRFAEASERIAIILEKHPESSIGNTLYNFFLLINGTALGFSGECERAIEMLDMLMIRLDDNDKAIDELAGAMGLKIDILEGNGRTAAAIAEMDRLIGRFGDNGLPKVQWRVENAMWRKARLLKENGK